jgi:hypothetical protein
MHQPEPRKCGCHQAPDRRTTKMPIDQFRDQSCDDQHKEEKSAAQSLH